MPSIVELIFSALGTQQTAAAVGDVQKSLGGLTQQLTATNTAAASTQAALGGATAGATQGASVFGTMRARASELSAELRDTLTPQLSGATKQLLGMAAAALGVRAVYSGFRDAIGEGADLQRLSMRLGENVRDLVIEEQAFKNAGLGAGYLGTAANLLDRALSPLNSNVKRNQEVFTELGITMDQLRGKSFGEQLTLLSAAFQRLPNQAERAAAAMQLFGRYAGGQMLQLLGDPHALELASQQAGELGDRMERDAAAFNETEKHLGVITLRLKEMWVAAAEQVLPTLEAIASVIGGMNLGGLGSVLGMVGPVGAGGLIGMVGIDMLDTGLLNAAEKFEGRMTGVLAGVASKFTGALATALPYGLAAALAVQIIAGVAQAWESSQIQDIIQHAKAVQSYEQPFRTAAGSEMNAGDAQRNLQSAAERLRDMGIRQGELQARANAAKQNAASGIYLGTTRLTNDSHPLNGAEEKELAALNDAIPKLAAEISNRYANPTATAKQISDNQLAALTKSLEPLVLQMSTLQTKHDQLGLEGMSPDDRMKALQAKRAPLEQQLAGINPALDAQSKQALTLSLENQIAEIKKQELETQKQIDEAAKKTATEQMNREVYALETQMEQAKAAGNDKLAQTLKEQIEVKRASVTLSGKDLDLANQRVAAEHKIWEEQQAQKDEKKKIEAEKDALDTTVSKLRQDLAKLEADYTRTDAEKWEDRRAKLEQEVAALQKAADHERALAAAARAPGGAGEQAALLHDAAAKGYDKQAGSSEVGIARLGANPNDVTAQLTAQATALRSSMGTLAQQIGQTWKNLGESMRTSLGSAFYDMLSHSQNFRQAAGAVAVSLERSIGQSVSQMAADWVVKHTFMTSVHAASEMSMTGATMAGGAARSGARIAETIIRGVQVGIRTAMHIAGEIAQTAVSAAQSAIRIGLIIAESLVSIIKAAAGAMSAMASIPYVGPILAIAAAAAMLAEGSSLIKGAREQGGPVEAGSAYLVGEKRPEVFVPHSDGYIFPDATTFSAPAPRSSGGGSALSSMANAATRAAPVAVGAGNGGRMPNVHIYLDKSSYRSALQSDMTGIAHEVYDKRARAS